MRRDEGAPVTFVVTTLWDSMEAIKQFAGDDLERAVVEPEARAALTQFDERGRHDEVVYLG